MSQSHEKFRGVLMGVAKAPGDTGKIHAKLGHFYDKIAQFHAKIATLHESLAANPTRDFSTFEPKIQELERESEKLDEKLLNFSKNQ